MLFAGKLEIIQEKKYWEGKEFQPDYSVFKRPSYEIVLTTFHWLLISTFIMVWFIQIFKAAFYADGCQTF